MTDLKLQRIVKETELAAQWEFIEDLRLALIKGTFGCALQEGADGREWPCGTCICALLGRVMPHAAPEYSQHNKPVDRVNEVWRAILQIRDFAART
jgi:hypothetical protein